MFLFEPMPPLRLRKCRAGWTENVKFATTLSACAKGQASVTKNFAMPTDPARIRRTDEEPDKCVWQLHQVYSNEDTKHWVQQTVERRHRLYRMWATGNRCSAG
jgi:hypothetical protein